VKRVALFSLSLSLFCFALFFLHVDGRIASGCFFAAAIENNILLGVYDFRFCFLHIRSKKEGKKNKRIRVVFSHIIV